MKLTTAIRKMLETAGVSTYQLQFLMGYKSRGAVSSLLVTENIKLSTLYKLAKICDYDIVLRDHVDGSEINLKIEES